ncbi:MAG: Arylsulfatase precursor [Verrucomicrobiota bacterium]
MATLAAAVGTSLPPNSAHDSHDLLSVWKSPASASPRRTIVHNTTAQGYAVRHDQWLLVAAKTGAVSKVPAWFDPANGYTPHALEGELYDLGRDLGQRDNLYASEPGKVAELRALSSQVKARGQVR